MFVHVGVIKVCTYNMYTYVLCTKNIVCILFVNWIVNGIVLAKFYLKRVHALIDFVLLS